ncbi:MAG: hypothetical protein IT385_28860 [Deltaproteobacteria bacterium]|nr:hypothetical protein [Deltaproteobacteria bacterium]
MFRLSFIVVIGSLLAACALPEGDQSSPSGVHYKWIHARAAGGVDAMWELLDPGVKKELERWLIAERLAIDEIKTAYPKEDATAALAAMGGPERGEAGDPKALFQLIVRPAPEAVGSLGAIAARVRSEEVAADGSRATIRTFGGDEVTMVKGDDERWYATLSPQDLERLRNARSLAEQNLARVRANLKKLGRTQ